MKLINLIGQTFGTLTVMSKARRNKYGHLYWLCECSCGKTTEVIGHTLRSGETKSCGCRQHSLKHGHNKVKKRSRTYSTWLSMLSRCTNPNYAGYKNYGGRGITVHERYLKFENFLKDMGEKPAGLTLDRIDNNKGYEPGNCKWSTHKEQNQNRRNTRNITYNGETHCLSEWARIV